MAEYFDLLCGVELWESIYVSGPPRCPPMAALPAGAQMLVGTKLLLNEPGLTPSESPSVGHSSSSRQVPTDVQDQIAALISYVNQLAATAVQVANLTMQLANLTNRRVESTTTH